MITITEKMRHKLNMLSLHDSNAIIMLNKNEDREMSVANMINDSLEQHELYMIRVKNDEWYIYYIVKNTDYRIIIKKMLLGHGI